MICCAGESAKGNTDCRQKVQTNEVLMSDLEKRKLKVKHMHGIFLWHWRKTAEEKTQIGIELYCRQRAYKCVLPNVRSEKINVER